ncbi:unnamed protein product, partial [Symbiodinium sp. KB8]
NSARGDGLSTATAGTENFFHIEAHDSEGNQLYNFGSQDFEIAIEPLFSNARLVTPTITPMDWEEVGIPVEATSGSRKLLTQGDLRPFVDRGSTAVIGIANYTISPNLDDPFTESEVWLSSNFVENQGQYQLYRASSETGTYKVTYNPADAGKYEMNIRLPDTLAKYLYIIHSQDKISTLHFSFLGNDSAVTFPPSESSIKQTLDSMEGLNGVVRYVELQRVDEEHVVFTLYMSKNLDVDVAGYDTNGVALHVVREQVEYVLTDRHIMGSPFTLEVVPGPTDPHSTTVYGMASRVGMAGEQNCGYIQARDANGNVQGEGGDQFLILVREDPEDNLVRGEVEQ